MRKRYPPFCVHFYKEHFYDFPFCINNFSTLDDALHYAASHHFDYKLFRIGYWTSLSPKKRYFVLEEFDAQRCLF